MNTCRAPHLEMSPKRFTMETVVLLSASEQIHALKSYGTLTESV